MATLTEGQHAGEFLVSEANGRRSRETITVASGQDLSAGTVLGKITADTLDGSADAGNTGDGTIGSISALAGVKEGDYIVTFIEPGTDAGDFVVSDPDGIEVGTGTVGSAFSAGGIEFTISDGATDFAAGDRFVISVSGSGAYKEYNPANIDGSGTAAGVLYDNVDATGGARSAAAIIRDAEVVAASLQWFDGATSGQKSTGQAELAELGIIAR